MLPCSPAEREPDGSSASGERAGAKLGARQQKASNSPQSRQGERGVAPDGWRPLARLESSDRSGKKSGAVPPQRDPFGAGLSFSGLLLRRAGEEGWYRGTIRLWRTIPSLWGRDFVSIG